MSNVVLAPTKSLLINNLARSLSSAGFAGDRRGISVSWREHAPELFRAVQSSAVSNRVADAGVVCLKAPVRKPKVAGRVVTVVVPPVDLKVCRGPKNVNAVYHIFFSVFEHTLNASAAVGIVMRVQWVFATSAGGVKSVGEKIEEFRSDPLSLSGDHAARTLRTTDRTFAGKDARSPLLDQISARASAFVNLTVELRVPKVSDNNERAERIAWFNFRASKFPDSHQVSPVRTLWSGVITTPDTVSQALTPWGTTPPCLTHSTPS